jgi:alpha-1,2-mannosyltransferase
MTNDSVDIPAASTSRWLRVALAAWAVLAVALCIKVAAEGNRHSVFGAFEIGSRGWWSERHVYDNSGFYYTPTFSVLFSPFAFLPAPWGQMLWGLLSVGAFLWSLRVFYRNVLPAHWPADAEAAFLLLVLAGSLRGMWSLQSNALLMACILFAAAAVVRYRWWRAAWLLAAPVYIKVWPIIAAGLLAVHWPSKLIGRLILVCVALAAVPFLTKVPTKVIDGYREWIDCLQQRQATAQRFTGYRDAWTIWEQIHTPVDTRAYFDLQATAGLATLAWSVWLRRRKRPAAEIVTYTLAMWSVWQLLLGPGSERLTYLIVTPFASWAIITSFIERRNRWLSMAAFIALFFLGSGNAERILMRFAPAAIALQPLGLILFAAWLAQSALSENCWKRTGTDDITPIASAALLPKKAAA